MLLVVIAAVVGATLPGIPTAGASAPPKLLTSVCVDNGDGAVRASVPCGPGDSRRPLRLNRRSVFCVAADASVRKLPSGYCTGQSMKLPKVAPTYFCAQPPLGTLRLVAHPASCSSREKRFVVVDRAPSAASLSDTSVPENSPARTLVGDLSAADPDLGDRVRFRLVPGAGATDNAQFVVRRHRLYLLNGVDHETRPTLQLRVQARDRRGLAVEHALVVNVSDVNEAPTALALDGTSMRADVVERVATLTSTDPDVGDQATYAVMAGGGSFQVRNAVELWSKADVTANTPVTVRVTDAGGLSFEKTFVITVTDQNDAPSAPVLGDDHVDENQAAGSVVGGLSSTDPDAGDTLSYSLAAGSGDADNAAFAISGTDLVTGSPFDFETRASYSVRVAVTDAGGLSREAAYVIHVDDANDNPTQVTLSDSHVLEHAPAGTTVGTLDAVDPDAGDTHDFTLVAGAGSDDNASFTIAGDVLETAVTFDYLTDPTQLIRVRAQDASGATVETQLTVTVDNVNDPPTALALDSTSVPEGSAVGTTVGTFSTTDLDGVAPYGYALVTGTGDDDNASFAVSGGTLASGAVFDVDTKSSYAVRVRVTDAGGLSFERAFTITVTDVNEAPTGPTLSNSHVDENAAVPTLVGTLASADPDAGDGATYTLVSGSGSSGNSSFAISGSSLNTAAVLDFETQPAYDIRVRITDTRGLTSEATFTITVDDVNDAPVAVTDNYSGVIGNTKATVGTVTTAAPKVALTGSVPLANDTDQDAGSALSIVAATVATTGGGSVTIDAAGNFLYVPQTGDKSQTDSFSYSVTDGIATVVGTVNLGIGSDLVWYVDRSVATAGAGTSTSPFKSLASLGGASDPDTAGDTIFVYGNATAYDVALTMEAGQRLVGQSVGLSFGAAVLVPAAGSNPTITTSAVPGLSLGEGSFVDGMTVRSGTSATGVDSATLESATQLTGYTGVYALSVTGGAGTITVKAAIASAFNSRALSVTGRTGGTVDVTGAVTGSGVALTDNAGSTVRLSGGLVLTSTVDTAFVATGGGTVTVTGATNTIATSGVAALTVTDTTIGADGLTFRNISSSNSGISSPTNAIVLVNTGGLGGLTVTGVPGVTPGAPNSCGRGTGSDCSGGIIGGTEGPAIVLNATRAPSLSRIAVSGADADGISGTAVDGLTIDNSYISSNGDAAGEDNIDLGGSANAAPHGWSGTATISNSYVAFGYDSNVVAGNSSGSAALVVSNSWLWIAGPSSSVPSSDALAVRALGTAHLAVDVTGSVFNNNKGGHLRVVAGEDATLDHVTITGNQLAGITTQAAQGIVISSVGPWTGSATFTVSGNTINDTRGGAIMATAVGTSSGSLFTGTIANNTIGVTTRVRSCSLTASGISVASHDGAGTATVAVTGNTINRCADRGIDVAAGAGANVLNLTVTGNTTTTNAADTNTRQGFFALIGLAPSDTSTSCLDVRGNSFHKGTLDTAGLAVQHPYGGLVIPGYSGSGTSGSAVAAYVDGLNPLTNVVTATDPLSGGSYAGTGTTCATP